jgi:hypothetical protein
LYLPETGYGTLEAVIKAYNTVDDFVSIADICKRTGTDRAAFTHNHNFLLALKLLEGTHTNKRLTPLGRKLAKAIQSNSSDSISKCWRETIEKEKNFRQLIAAVNNKGTIEFTELLNVIYHLRNKKPGPRGPHGDRVYQGAATIVKILEIAKYIRVLSTSPKTIVPFSIGDQEENQVINIDRIDSKILTTLSKMIPSAALSYEQAMKDLSTDNRISWRGPATDLREALRETLDYLAPDNEVISQQGFKLEKDQKYPTMKQKVRFILRKRGLSSSSTQAPEDATQAVDEAISSFVRSVYGRSNLSTHMPTDKNEVLRVRDLVKTSLCELLEIHI